MEVIRRERETKDHRVGRRFNGVRSYVKYGDSQSGRGHPISSEVVTQGRVKHKDQVEGVLGRDVWSVGRTIKEYCDCVTIAVSGMLVQWVICLYSRYLRRYVWVKLVIEERVLLLTARASHQIVLKL